MSPTVPPLVSVGQLFVLLVFTLVVRVWLHKRRTGSSGIRLDGLSTTAGRASALIVISPCLSLAACFVDIASPLRHVVALDSAARVIVGTVLWLVGFAVMWFAQEEMRDSWRAGVDESERTDLVTRGLFGLIRNPIFSGWLVVAVAGFVLVPNVLSVIAFVALFLGIEIQVRRVEEPYLERMHGDGYRRYTSTVGRLVPAVGRR